MEDVVWEIRDSQIIFIKVAFSMENSWKILQNLISPCRILFENDWKNEKCYMNFWKKNILIGLWSAIKPKTLLETSNR